MEKKINNAQVAFHSDRMNGAMADLIKGLVTVRNAVQSVVEDAMLAHAYDRNGDNEIGTATLTEFIQKVGATRGTNITAIRDYILFCFCPKVAPSEDGKKWVFNPEDSAVRYNSKDNKFEINKKKIPVLDEEGSPVSKDGKTVTKLAVIEMTVAKVQTRIASAKWYDFNAEKPEPAYKGKLVNAIKNDIAAMDEGKYFPTDEDKRFLAEVQAIALKLGIELN